MTAGCAILRVMFRRVLVLIVAALSAAHALACCIEPVDKFGKLCGKPCHAANEGCPGCTRCDTHCLITTKAAGNRCPTCNQFDVEGQCYNPTCPEYSRSMWGPKPPSASPSPSPSGSESPPPPTGTPPPAGPDVTPDPATEGVIRDVERRVRPICEALGLDPGECADTPAITDLIANLPPGARPTLESVTRGPDPSDPAPVATTGPGVDAFLAFQSRDANGAYVLAVDPGGQPYANLTVTVTLDGEARTGVTDSAGWFRATWPPDRLGRPVTVAVGAPASTNVRDIRKLTWVVLRVPRAR